MEKKEFKIEGMNCHHCVMGVEAELRDAGFENFKVEIGSALVDSDCSEESKTKIETAIENAGFKVIY